MSNYPDNYSGETVGLTPIHCSDCLHVYEAITVRDFGTVDFYYDEDKECPECGSFDTEID